MTSMGVPSAGNNRGRNGDWRNYVIAIQSTLLLAGISGWIAIGSDHVKKEELSGLRQSIQNLSTSVQTLQTSVAVLNDRIPQRDLGR